MTTHFEKEVEIFSAEGRAASIVTSYIEKQNAVERDVDRDGIERSFLISSDKVWLNIFFRPYRSFLPGQTFEVN